MMLFVSALVLVIALFSAQELFAYHVKRPLSDESSSSNSDDYPILTAQTSLFSTSRDQDTQAARAARSKMSYLNTLISHHELYGTWQSTVGNETSPNQQGYSTLRYMEESNSYEESFDMVLCLYNGFYTNTNYSCVSFSEYIPFMPASSFNEENMTINLQQVTVHVAQGLNSEINQLGKECNVNCSVYFTNKTTGAPFVPSYDEDTDKNTFKLQFSIQSVDCGINIVTNQMSQEDNVTKSLIMSYSFVMSAAAWLQCFLCYFFARLFEVKKELCQRISQGTLKMINCFDLFIAFQCFFQLTTSYVLAFTAVPYLILVFYFQPKAMRAISQAQGDLKNKGLHRLSLLNFALLVVSAVTAVLSAFFQRPDWMFFVFIFHQFPQIIQNYQTQRKYRWKECLVFLFVIPKILYMMYVLVAPQNLFRTSPDHGFSFVLFNILAFQLLILLVQRHYPMLCVRRKVVYQSFSIHERKPDEEMCSVCLENFEATPTAPSTPATVTSSTTSEGLDDSLLKTQTPVDTKMIMTPCNHQFHECCLRDWTKLKSVCPYCRFELPPLPEDDD